MRTSFIIGTVLALGAPALAQPASTSDADAPDDASDDASDDDAEFSRGRDAAVPLAKGGFSRLATTPSADGHRGGTFVSFDSSRDRARVDTDVQVSLLPRLQLAVGLDYENERSHPSIGARYDVLREGISSLDLQLGAGWDRYGVNDVSAMYGEVAAGRSYFGGYLYGSGRLDLDTGGDDSGLRLGGAALFPVTGQIVAGVDSRIDVALTRNDEGPMTQSNFAMQVGPVVGYANQLVAVTASIGFAANDPRIGNAETGAYAGAGLGLAF